jgi:HK97 gp10 family phage protein
MNADQLQANLEKAARELEHPRRALERIMSRVVEGGKRRAPVDTGNLRDSIVGRVTSRSEVVVTAHVHYASHVHDGTSRMRARPFLTDAMADEAAAIDRILTDFGEGVLREVER